MFNDFAFLIGAHKEVKNPFQFPGDHVQAGIGGPFRRFHASPIHGRVECPSQNDTVQVCQFTHQCMYGNMQIMFKLYVFQFQPPKIPRATGTDSL